MSFFIVVRILFTLSDPKANVLFCSFNPFYRPLTINRRVSVYKKLEDGGQFKFFNFCVLWRIFIISVYSTINSPITLTCFEDKKKINNNSEMWALVKLHHKIGKRFSTWVQFSWENHTLKKSKAFSYLFINQ